MLLLPSSTSQLLHLCCRSKHAPGIERPIHRSCACAHTKCASARSESMGRRLGRGALLARPDLDLALHLERRLREDGRAHLPRRAAEYRECTQDSRSPVAPRSPPRLRTFDVLIILGRPTKSFACGSGVRGGLGSKLGGMRSLASAPPATSRHKCLARNFAPLCAQNSSATADRRLQGGEPAPPCRSLRCLPRKPTRALPTLPASRPGRALGSRQARSPHLLQAT